MPSLGPRFLRVTETWTRCGNNGTDRDMPPLPVERLSPLGGPVARIVPDFGFEPG